jgi:hypothetical protein
MRILAAVLLQIRVVAAALVLIVVVGINFTWVFTVPACLKSGWGTPGYSASAKSLEDDDGAFGCWWKTVTKERVRERASKNGRGRASGSIASAAQPGRW